MELLTRETGNPLTVGARFDPRQLVDTLAKDVRLGETTDDPTILATGGFPVRLARERGLLLRANPWSEGDGLDLALERGGAAAGDLEEFYGRAMPAVDELAEDDFVRLSQLYGRYARVTAHDMSEQFEGPPTWSEVDLAQAIARMPDGLAWFSVDPADLGARVRERTVGEMIDAARGAGAPVEEDNGRIAVLVRAAVTQTLGGIRVDEDARAADGLYAAGADVGGISTGGWSSGLAARARPRPGRRRVGARLARQRLEIGGAAVVAGERRRCQAIDLLAAALVELDDAADRRQLAVPLVQLVPGRLPDEEQVLLRASPCAGRL